ncbi:MAG: hypothetical protein EAZ61_07215 [Oscillatoriales cyanobacterium]|nr:MAG: hypothetical protein EAZ61_07215 [Oscillatoriales cyanobacterium]
MAPGWAASLDSLGDRVTHFPDWTSRPALGDTRSDLAYPDWMAGTWHVTSTLTAMYAPLAPDIVTPGYEGNRRYLDRPVEFDVRFAAARPQLRGNLPFGALGKPPIVADRQFNGEQILKAYVGDQTALQVRVEPNDPNQQATVLPDGRQLIAVVTARGGAMVGDRDFIGSELVTQFFRTQPEIYLNGVETTTAYHQQADDRITADQFTAVYLSPQDPEYFTAGDRPVALYRYDLQLDRLDP